MFKNHIVSSFRAIRQSSIYGLLSIAGLAMGITFAGLIFLWVEKELQFDHQYGKHNQLYSIRLNMDNGGKLESNESVPGPMAKAIRGTIPGLVNNCRFGFSRELFGVKDNINYADGAYVDTSFFSMMQLPFVSGNTAGFDHPHTIVLTEKMAQQFFGAINPTGKTVKLNNAREFVVIGVIGNPPLNSRLQFDWLAPIANYLEDNTWLEPWGNFGIFTLVELSAGTDVSRVNQALSAILQPTNKIYAHANCRLWSMNDWHLRNNFINGEQNGGAIHVVKLIAAMGRLRIKPGCAIVLGVLAIGGSRLPDRHPAGVVGVARGPCLLPRPGAVPLVGVRHRRDWRDPDRPADSMLSSHQNRSYKSRQNAES